VKLQGRRASRGVKKKYLPEQGSEGERRKEQLQTKKNKKHAPKKVGSKGRGGKKPKKKGYFKKRSLKRKKAKNQILEKTKKQDTGSSRGGLEKGE